MLKYVVVAAFAAFLAVFSAPAFAADAPRPSGVIGTIMEVEGTATLTPAGQGASRRLVLKDQIHMNDLITTGPKSKVFVLFIDNTQFTLAENTKLTVNTYVFDPDNNANNKADYNVVNGTFQYLSGLIAKKKNPDVNIDTPYGTIGIRGTKLWGGNIKDAYGVHVEEGAVSVRNDGGQVYVNKGEGTALKSRKTPPPKAAPWPKEQLAFIASTILLANQAQVFERVLGFQGQNRLLQGQFKNFLQLNGKLPGGGNMQNLVPGGNKMPFNLPQNQQPQQNNGKKNRGGGQGFPGLPGIPGFGGF